LEKIAKKNGESCISKMEKSADALGQGHPAQDMQAFIIG
jgi:hypothetical protein